MSPEKIAEGKTKIIWATGNPYTVLVESKDDITAGDGAKRDIVENKGALATETTSNCFSLLNAASIPTHFIRRAGERTFLAKKVKMFPVELVARRIATGSYLRRNPLTAEGTIFDPLVFEVFYKDDELHDPLIFWNGKRGCIELYDAKRVGAYLFDLGPRHLLTPAGETLSQKGLNGLREVTCDVFLTLEEAWAKQQVALVDLKIECGWTLTGELVVADVIDNDSWRIWPGGDKTKMVDKQVYRDMEESSPEVLGVIKKNYAWVAESTQKFIK